MPDPVRYVPRPFVRESYTPDNTTLLKLMQMAGQAQQDATLQRGQTKGQGLMSLGNIISQALGNWRQEGEQKQAFQARQAFEQQKLDEANQIRRDEMAARAAEREEANRIRQEGIDRQNSRDAVLDARLNATDAVENTMPGPIDPTAAATLRAYPGTAPLVSSRSELPARPVLSEMSPMAPPSTFDVRGTTPKEAQQAATLAQAQQAAAATAARQAATDTRLTGMAAEAARHNQAMERRPVGGSEQPSLQTREVVDETGQRVMANFNPRNGTWTRPDGSVIQNPKPSSGTEKASSGVQKRVLNFFNRAEQANNDLESLEPEIMKMGAMEQGRMSWLPNFAQTPTGRQYNQAQRAFTEARLRKDSGAAIPPHEFESDRQTYFPQPFDDKVTLEQKRRARSAMLASLAFESGQALGEFMGSSEEAAATVQTYKNRAADQKAPLKNGTTVSVGGGFMEAVDPQGNVHHAPAGTALPAGWKLKGG